jgi:hypothetical protein
MTMRDYELGQQIEMAGYPFYAIIQAAMRRADTDNAFKLQQAFPHTWDELWKRYNAPGGRLKGDPPIPQEGAPDDGED